MTRSSTIRYFSWAVQEAVELQLDLVVFLTDVHVPLRLPSGLPCNTTVRPKCTTCCFSVLFLF